MPEESGQSATATTLPGHKPAIRAVLKRRHEAIRRLMSRKGVVFALLLAIILAPLGVMWTLSSARFLEPKKIIFIGRQPTYEPTDPPAVRFVKDHDQFNFAALSHYLEKLEQDLGQDLFELEYRSNNENYDHSIAIYDSLADDPSTVLVIDNTWSAEFQPAAASIVNGGIPVIALNADKGAADFNDQVIFLGADDNTPIILVDFLTEVLMENEVTFVTEEDYPPRHVFSDIFEDRTDVTVLRTFSLKGIEPRPGALEEAVKELSAYLDDESARRRPIILNMHGNWGSALISALDARYPDLTLLAGGSAVNQRFNFHRFGIRYPSNRFFVNFSSAPDAVSERTHADLRRFGPAFTKYVESRNAPLFLSRIRDTATLIRNALGHREGEELLTRETLLDYMAYIAGLDNRCIETPYGLLDFDANLIRKKNVQFVLNQNGEADSYLEQLDRNGDRIPSIRMGFQVDRIFDIDVRGGDFGAEFRYWTQEPYHDLSATDRKESATDRWLAEAPVFLKNLKLLDSGVEPVTVRVDKEIYKSYSLTGRFYTRINLRDYPIDRQHLRIEAEVLSPNDFIRVLFNRQSLRATGVRDGAGVVRSEATVDEWNVEEVYMTVDNKLADALDERSFLRECRQEFKQLTAHVIVKRRFTDAFLMVVVPLLLIGLVAISLLFVSNIEFHAVGDAAIGVFLGIMAFLIALTDIAPDLRLVSRGGAFFWSTFGVVIGVILVIVAVNSDYVSERRRPTILQAGKIVIPALYLLAMILIIML